MLERQQGCARLDKDAADVEVGAHGLLAALHWDDARAERHDGLNGRVRPQEPRLRQRQRRRVVRGRGAVLEPARTQHLHDQYDNYRDRSKRAARGSMAYGRNTTADGGLCPASANAAGLFAVAAPF